MLFVGLLAMMLGLFLQLKALSITFANIDFSTYADSIGMALLLGLVAGISERLISVELIARAREMVVPANEQGGNDPWP